MNIIIRNETPADYCRIGEINARAFGPGTEFGPEHDLVPEVLLVDALRHSPLFDPALALVACVEGQVVGQALFNPLDLRIAGQAVPTVSLAPLTVDPDWQRRGVGAALLQEGHRRALERGFGQVLLVGHPSYYPRFGYRTGMFGTSAIHVTVAKPARQLNVRPFAPADAARLHSLWSAWYADVDLVVDPGTFPLAWMSHTASARASVFERDGELVGYARYGVQDNSVRMFLAADADAAAGMAAWLLTDRQGELELPIAGGSRAAEDWFGGAYRAERRPWQAAMLNLLDEGCEPAAAYIRGVARGTREIGLPVMPAFLEPA